MSATRRPPMCSRPRGSLAGFSKLRAGWSENIEAITGRVIGERAAGARTCDGEEVEA